MRITLRIIAVFLLAGGAILWIVLRGSLARLDGDMPLPGLGAEVTVERDADGVVTISAASRIDLARATGFVHAQDRYFQMDLLRRRAAGELAGLFGEVAIAADKGLRIHRFRSLARTVLADAPEVHRDLVDAYAAGVNAGLAALHRAPPEYLLLGEKPAEWTPADSLLVLYSMFLELHDEWGDRESDLALLEATLPAELVAFMTPPGTPWDAPLEGEPLPVPPVPGPEVIDLRELDGVLARGPTLREPATPGSNSWAVAGAHTPSGRALVANDMHLPLAVPNIFYRARLRVTGEQELDLAGVTLPGVPSVVAGSNGHVAWGFTNSYGDWTDLVDLVLAEDDPGRYRTADGWREMEVHRERIEVAGGAAVEIEVPWTIWGPVAPAGEGRPARAVVWLAHRPEAANLALVDMERVRDVEAALAVANRTGVPPQNIVVGDAGGNIAWSIAGMIPVRRGYDPLRPADWSEPATGWQGWLAPTDYPRIVNPPGGRIWTANARIVGGADLALLGDGGYALGARARQIRDALEALDGASYDDMLAIHLDDRALFLSAWRDLLLEVLGADPAISDERRAVVDALEGWSGRAAVDDAGFRLVFEFRARMYDVVFGALTAPARAQDPDFAFRVSSQAEGALWRLVTERPAHLLPPPWETWPGLMRGIVDEMVADLGNDAEAWIWGNANRAAIRHPLSGALPFLSGWLDMPEEPLPGGVNMPRVQRNSFGASERFAVSPGLEAEGYLHLPGGASGHPLSPFYRSGHEAWVEGRRTPFLPGESMHTLTLNP